MIDGFTLRNAVLTIGTTGILKHNGLIFTQKVDEVHKVYDNYQVRGSFHKNKNKGQHNADDYFFSDFKNTLNQWHEETGLNPEITVLNKVEFGVNIKLPFNANKALQCIILHKTNTVDWMVDKSKKHNYKCVMYDNYSNKFYNKSEITDIEPYQSENILRIEVSIDKMKHLTEVMTYTKLSDLLDVELWKRFEIILIETIQDCLIIDFTDNEVSQLTDQERNKYLKYINTDFWHKLSYYPKEKRIKGKRTNEKRKQEAAYKIERDECDRFIIQHSKSTLKTNIINMVRVKCEELRDVSRANEIKNNWYKLPTFENEETKEFGTNYPVDKRVICTKVDENVKLCQSCGKIIQDPKWNQKFCSESKFGKDGKRCRNIDSNPRNNPRNNTIRTYNSILLKGNLLFDMTEYIAPDKLRHLG